MTPELVKRLVREFAAMGGEEVTLTGGEPLINPHLLDLLAEANEVGLATVVFTSGVVQLGDRPAAATPGMFSSLAPVLGRIVFSMYSIDPSIHDSITCIPGSLAFTREAIRRAISAGIRTELHFVPTQVNYRDLPALVEEAARMGASAVRVIRYVPQGRGRVHHDRLRLTPPQQSDLRDLLEAAVTAGRITVRVGSGFRYLLDQAPACTAAVDELVVSWNGQVYPCSGFTGYRRDGAIGTVRAASLGDVWRGAPYLRAVRELLANRSTIGNSQGCDVGCLAQKAAESGHLTDAVEDPDAAAMASQAAAGVLGSVVGVG